MSEDLQVIISEPVNYHPGCPTEAVVVINRTVRGKKTGTSWRKTFKTNV